VPQALLEAMAAGLPCVAASVGGVPALIDHDQNGLLFDPNEPASLRAALDALTSERAARLARSGAKRAGEHDWSLIAARVEAWLERA
jgi:glycosyltransferase involved in cell wall biosynthesis